MPDESIAALANLRNFRVTRDPRGVVTAVLDVRDRGQNVFNEDVIFELQQIVNEMEHDPAARLLLFRSGKDSGFLAGADLHQIVAIRSPQTADQVLTIGQKLFDRIERLPMPTLAVIHGPCLGGGLEFAMACRYRVALDDKATRLGSPEVELGLLPGWGGTQRLPQLVGLACALSMLLTGRKLSAREAAALGLVDAAWPPEQFSHGVEQFVLERLEGEPLARRRAGFWVRLPDRTRFGQRLVLWAAGRRTAAPGRHYPALPAILSAVERGLRCGREQGLASERAGFAELLFTPACRNLMGLFFQRERARKPDAWLADQGPAPRPVRRVAVIGAGVMGAGIAQLAAYGGLEVVLKDVNQEILARGLRRIEDLMEKAKRKGLLSAEEAATCLNRVSAYTSWDAVADVDLAVEAVPENEDLKREVLGQLGECLSPKALIVSNTSSLSIGRLADAARWPARVAGLHFFNPVHRMQLVEIVRHSRTSDAAVAALVSLVRRLGKVPMIVADRPGFLVNRVLFPYLDEAVRLLCEGAAAERVDRSARDFGMPMGPLELLDQVGIDVAADIAGILAGLAPEPGPTLHFLTEMAARGWTGTKAGRGIYDWRRHGRRGHAVRWDRPFLQSLSAGDGEAGEASSAGAWRDRYQRRLMCALVLAAIRCVEEQVVAEPWMVDLGMVLGTGFAPFRGGPLRMADDYGLDRLVLDLEELQRTCGPRFSPCELLREMRSRGARFYPEQEEPAVLKESETILNHRK